MIDKRMIVRTLLRPFPWRSRLPESPSVWGRASLRSLQRNSQLLVSVGFGFSPLRWPICHEVGLCYTCIQICVITGQTSHPQSYSCLQCWLSTCKHTPALNTRSSAPVRSSRRHLLEFPPQLAAFRLISLRYLWDTLRNTNNLVPVM